MIDEKKRFGQGLAVALAVHIAVAAVLGIFGYRFVQTPPEVLEVTLAGGGGGGQEIEEPEQEEQIEENIVKSIEDIVDQKLKPKPEKKKQVVKQKKETGKPSPNPAPGPKTGEGEGSGGGTGGGNGTGSGNGEGDGSGEGRGVPVVPPRVLREVSPRYPASARNSGATGVVRVRMLVDANGNVQSASVVSSSGNADMDANAVEVVYKWRFSPARDKYGQNAACYVTRGIKFSLR